MNRKEDKLSIFSAAALIILSNNFQREILITLYFYFCDVHVIHCKNAEYPLFEYQNRFLFQRKIVEK